MRITLVAVLALAPLTLACSKKPVLYPNATYHRMGPEIAEKDVDLCMDYAEEMGARANRAGRVAGNTAGQLLLYPGAGTEDPVFPAFTYVVAGGVPIDQEG